MDLDWNRVLLTFSAKGQVVNALGLWAMQSLLNNYSAWVLQCKGGHRELINDGCVRTPVKLTRTKSKPITSGPCVLAAKPRSRTAIPEQSSFKRSSKKFGEIELNSFSYLRTSQNLCYASEQCDFPRRGIEGGRGGLSFMSFDHRSLERRCSHRHGQRPAHTPRYSLSLCTLGVPRTSGQCSARGPSLHPRRGRPHVLASHCPWEPRSANDERQVGDDYHGFMGMEVGETSKSGPGTSSIGFTWEPDESGTRRLQLKLCSNNPSR